MGLFSRVVVAIRVDLRTILVGPIDCILDPPSTEIYSSSRGLQLKEGFHPTKLSQVVPITDVYQYHTRISGHDY